MEAIEKEFERKRQIVIKKEESARALLEEKRLHNTKEYIQKQAIIRKEQALNKI